MPYINVRITNEPQNTPQNKAEVIKRITQVMVDVLGKDPDTTFVVIDEVELDNWGVGGMTAPQWRARQK